MQFLLQNEGFQNGCHERMSMEISLFKGEIGFVRRYCKNIGQDIVTKL